jgi:CYTH domain-containing protein
MADRIDRTPGQGRYAVTEREKRWLLRRVPDGVSEPIDILDTYLSGTTLRLRRAQSGSTVVYKLGQKVRLDPTNPSNNHMTNLYLSRSEYELLGRVEGTVLSKTRWHWRVGDRVFSVDQFGQRLQGLVVAETELHVDVVGSAAPPLAVAEVTEDDRFSGGHLASLTPPEAEDLLKVVSGMTEVPTPE